MAMSSQSMLGISSRNWRMIRPSAWIAKSRGGFPESLCTQKMPGCRRLLTIPDASGTSLARAGPSARAGADRLTCQQEHHAEKERHMAAKAPPKSGICAGRHGNRLRNQSATAGLRHVAGLAVPACDRKGLRQTCARN